MKGLLIKDFRLLWGQKNSFFIIIVISIGMTAFYSNPSFVLFYLPFLISMFTLSTISYDEFDNGNAFLFTLPISRAGYTVEKYCLALLLGGGSLVLALLLTLPFGSGKGIALGELMLTAVIVLPTVILIQAVTIPFQLKFGAEKGRIAMLGAIGFLGVCCVAAVKVCQMLGVDLLDILDNLSGIGMGVLIAVVFAVVLAILLVSVRISIRIMTRKEL